MREYARVVVPPYGRAVFSHRKKAQKRRDFARRRNLNLNGIKSTDKSKK